MKKLIIYTVLGLSFSLSASAQENNQELNSQVVKVVKAYTPEVADADKIVTLPKEDIGQSKKDSIVYQTYTPSVVSTFKPSKLQAVGQDRNKAELAENNYLILGYGNYKTPLIDFYASNVNSTKHRFGLNVYHHSSEGGIENIRLKNSFINTRINGFYNRQISNYQFKSNLSYRFNLSNFYGAKQSLITDAFVSNVNVKNYNSQFVGDFSFVNNVSEDAYFQGANFSSYYFWDRFSSTESRINLKASFRVPIEGEWIDLGIGVDRISNTFEQGLSHTNQMINKYTLFDFQPNFQFIRDNIKFNLGINIAYAMSSGDGNNVFRIYPKVGASINIIDELMIARASFYGKMENNSYRDALYQNQFLSPTQSISPHMYDFVLNSALEGRLSQRLHYLAELEITSEKGFLNIVKNREINPADPNFPANPWEAYNSFTMAMDTVNVLRLKGALDYEIVDNLVLGGSVSINTYSSKMFDKVYNRPNTEFTFSADYHFLRDFNIRTSLYYAGSRYYGEYYEVASAGSYLGKANTLGKLDPYLDLNLDASYSISKRLAVFVMFNNILGNSYELYKDFAVQGFQVMAGLTYKF